MYIMHLEYMLRESGKNILVLAFMMLTLLNGMSIAPNCSPEDALFSDLTSLFLDNSLKGIQLEITHNATKIFNLSMGTKNEKKEQIDQDTVFRVASVSKSFASLSLLKLIREARIKDPKSNLSLQTKINDILPYAVIHPSFATINITIEMLLSHQSSIAECDPYYSQFLSDTTQSFPIPSLKEILVPGGKYYNKCLFSIHAPGTYFQYTNLNYGIAGTLVEILSNQRYDVYLSNNILKTISQGLKETASFVPWTINPVNLGTLYQGNPNGTCIPSYDNYPSGVIPERPLGSYVPGWNAVVFSPQGGLRASVSHLNNYMNLINNETELFAPRGPVSGSLNDFHLYGLGMYSTSYYTNDNVIAHEFVKGHTGAAYGLLSAIHFIPSKNISFAYIINGATFGYQKGEHSSYELEREIIYEHIQQFISVKFPTL